MIARLTPLLEGVLRHGALADGAHVGDAIREVLLVVKDVAHVVAERAHHLGLVARHTVRVLDLELP